MKTKIEFFAICFVGILYAFFTKNSEVIFLGAGGSDDIRCAVLAVTFCHRIVCCI